MDNIQPTAPKPTATVGNLADATIIREWMTFAAAFQAADSIDARELSKAWNAFSRTMDTWTKEAQLRATK